MSKELEIFFGNKEKDSLFDQKEIFYCIIRIQIL